MKKKIIILTCFLLEVFHLFSQDISGYWQGVSYQITGGPSTYYPLSMQLVQNGDTINGTSTSKLPNGSPSYVTWSLSGMIINNIFNYQIKRIIAQIPPPFPYYWCRNGSGTLTYDSSLQTLTGPTNSPGCAGRGSIKVWRLKVISDTIFCEGKPVRLSVTGQNIKWYDNNSLSNLIDTGNIFSPVITTTTTYYVTQTHFNTESPAIAITVTIKPTPASTINASICEGQTYLGHSISGNYRDTLAAAGGCDSIRILNLIVKSKSYSTLAASVCEGQSYLGHTATGKYIDTLVAANGCDSIRTLNLTLKPRLFSVINQSICSGQTYLGHPTAGTYIDTFVAVNGCDSIRTLHLTIKQQSSSIITAFICAGQSYSGHTASGIYTDTLVAANGCDSTSTLHLTVLTKQYTTLDTTICYGSSFEGHTISGTYTNTLPSASGCDSVQTIHLTVRPPLRPFLGQDTSICRGDSLLLSPGIFNTYTWQDGSNQSYFVAKMPGTYSVTVTNGCSYAKTGIIIKEGSCDVYFPNAFTPNKDGLNDVFKVLNGSGLDNYHLSIYNRWGRKVFETTDHHKGWDGMVNGVLQPAATYVWYCRFNQSNLLHNMKGTVTLIR